MDTAKAFDNSIMGIQGEGTMLQFEFAGQPGKVFGTAAG